MVLGGVMMAEADRSSCDMVLSSLAHRFASPPLLHTPSLQLRYCYHLVGGHEESSRAADDEREAADSSSGTASHRSRPLTRPAPEQPRQHASSSSRPSLRERQSLSSPPPSTMVAAAHSKCTRTRRRMQRCALTPARGVRRRGRWREGGRGGTGRSRLRRQVRACGGGESGARAARADTEGWWRGGAAEDEYWSEAQRTWLREEGSQQQQSQQQGEGAEARGRERQASREREGSVEWEELLSSALSRSAAPADLPPAVRPRLPLPAAAAGLAVGVAGRG